MRVKFGDVVKEVKLNVDRANNPYEFYVAGDHMDSEDLHIHRKGKFATDDVGPAFTRIFKPGQILYGSRRTYLKKIAIADFEGICANTTFVLETRNEDILLQDLLPFIMLSEDFTHWSVSHSKGSTNPYVLFSDLSEFEFDLPSIEEQQVISNKLWTSYRLKDSYKELLAATREMVKSQFIEMFGNPISNDRNWDYECINSVAPESPAAHVDDDQVWLLNLDMIESNTGNIIEKVVVPKSDVLSAQPFDEGNVLFSKLRPYLNKVVFPKDKGYATTELVPLRPNQNKLNMVFFTYLLRSDQFVQFANDISGGTKMPRMPLKELREFKCILPPICLQEKFAAIVRQADKSEFDGFKSQFIEMFQEEQSVRLPELAQYSIGLTYKPADVSENGVIVLRSGNIQEGKIDLNDLVRVTCSVKEELLAKQGDILMCSRNGSASLVGKTAIIPELEEVATFGAFMTIIRSQYPGFLNAFFQTHLFRDQIKAGKSSTMNQITQKMLDSIQVPFPQNEKSMEEFASFAQQADKSEFELKQAIESIDKVIKSLINQQ